MKKSLLICLVSLGTLFSSVANANLAIFPLWTDGDTFVENEMLFSDNGLQLSITAWTSSFNTAQDQLQPWQQVVGDGLGVFRNDDGLGVISSEEDGNDLDGGSSDDYFVDGSTALDDPDEGLLFVFSETVSLFDIFMGDLDSSDDINVSLVDLTNPSSPLLLDSLIDLDPPGDDEYEVYDFGNALTGNAFMVWVDGGNDDVEVLGMAVTRVPAPGSVFLFATGLLALRFARRR